MFDFVILPTIFLNLIMSLIFNLFNSFDFKMIILLVEMQGPMTFWSTCSNCCQIKQDKFRTNFLSEKAKPDFNQNHDCCVFLPVNGCSARHSLVEIDFLMLKQLFRTLTEQNKQKIKGKPLKIMQNMQYKSNT